MKRLLSLVLCAVILATSFSVAAFAEYNGGKTISGNYQSADSDLNWTIDIDGTLFVEGTGVVPSIYNTEWNEFEFIKVILGEGITSVEDDAFLGLSELKEIDISDTVEKIGERAFYLCKNLKNIDLNNVKSIGAMAFYGCGALSEIAVFENVEEIGNYAFGYYCNEELDLEFAKYDDFKIIGNGGSSAEKYATDNEIDFISVSGEYKDDKSDFKWYVNLAEKTLVVDGVGEVPALADSAWKSFEITRVEIGEGITSLSVDAFLGLTALESVETPETLKTIGERAFYLCENLTEFDLKNVTEIGAMAFYGCNSLNEIKIPENTEKIGNYAFGYYCDEELDIELAKNSNFSVFGKSQTVAEQYASDNGFTFTNISPAQPEIIFIYSNKVGVTLFWNEIDGAEKYEIYRKTKKSEFEKIGESEDIDKAYCDLSVKNGETYYYAVSAVKDGYSSLLEKTEKIEFIKLDTPKLDSATMTKDGILVKWNTVKSAEGYTLYRCTEDTDWVQIADFNGAVKSFTDTTAKSGVTYYYTVKANNGFVESGCDYEGVSAVYLSVPKLTKISNVSNGIKVQWSKVSGATGYIIGRKTSSSGWSQIATVGNVSSYTDKTAKVGTTYTYTVVPVKNSIKGFYNEKGLTYKYLEKITVKSASNVNGGVKVAWSKASKGSGYLVYRKTEKGSWEKIAKITNLNTLQYTDKKAKSGVKYTYTVKVYSGSYLGAYDTTGKSILYLSAPKLTKVTSSKSGVTVNWGKVTGASGYYVYRKTGNGSWKKIATVKGGSKVSYLDKSAKKGTTYVYTIKAYNGKTQSSYNTTGLKIKDKY